MKVCMKFLAEFSEIKKKKVKFPIMSEFFLLCYNQLLTEAGQAETFHSQAGLSLKNQQFSLMSNDPVK